MLEKKKMLAIGLMSGTSADGVDAALIETDGEGHVVFKASYEHSYAPEFQKSMVRAQKEDLPLVDFLRLEKAITEHHADVVKRLLEKENLSPEDIDVIGFHGATVRHVPEEGITCQLGNASLLAYETGIPVVADFRRRDMAAGGEGAPLVPLFHEALLKGKKRPCAVVNIGGVSNLTYLGDEVIAGDCGPGMGLLDEYVSQYTAGKERFDESGKYAAKGTVDESLVKNALNLDFFKKDFPKSADRHEFQMINVLPLNFEDACATLCAITAECIASSAKKCGDLEEMWLTGGGAKNDFLVEQIQKRLPDVKVALSEDIGLRSDSMEAECFAWLAVRSLKKLPLSLPSTTACTQGVSGGILAQ